MRVYFLLLLFFITSIKNQAQQDSTLSYDEYIKMVKDYHPMMLEADLITEQADNILQISRGGFDPKVYVAQKEKLFKENIYYDRLAAKFSVPTWYGIDIQGGLDENQGNYLNPENYTRGTNLYSVGVSMPLARGLLMNERMLQLKQAKIYQNQSEVERQIRRNQIIYDASIAYFNWYKYAQEYAVYDSFMHNAQQRLDGIRKNYLQGDKPAIDTTETRIALQNRKLQLEKTRLLLAKARLEVSNYLWFEDMIPLQLLETVRPLALSEEQVAQVLGTDTSPVAELETIPKLQLYEYKKQMLQTENKLHKFNLLPEIRLNYKLLSETPFDFGTYNIHNHSSSISLLMPLLLRKERGKYKQNQTKLLSLKLQQQNASVQVQNKLRANQVAINSYRKQSEIFDTLNADYQTLLNGENRKFVIGESSVFMVNSRESKLIENLIKAIEIEYNLYAEIGQLYRNLGL